MYSKMMNIAFYKHSNRCAEKHLFESMMISLHRDSRVQWLKTNNESDIYILF